MQSNQTSSWVNLNLVSAYGVGGGLAMTSGIAMVNIYWDGTTNYASISSISVSGFTWVSINSSGVITFQQTTGFPGTNVRFMALRMAQ